MVAEAVETAEQHEHLRRINCDLAQGWFFGPPMLAPELEAWSRAQRVYADLSTGEQAR